MNETHNPDVLSCLANLSNDEVFTPPSVVNQMLDMLPQELFRSSKTTFLDIGCKSGVFLREITKRLIAGLADEMPDLQTRVDHILHKQVFGIATTELTSLVSRRTLYCSKYPNCRYSTSQFKTVEGNIRFRNIPHTFVNGRCKRCGASEDQFGTKVRKGLETHAYEFIHTDHPEEIFKMKFDVIVGNPPYQCSTGGAQSQALPLYHKFVEQAKLLMPRYLVMITPSRWLAGGMGLDEFRRQMLCDRRISDIVDYSLSTDCFPGVDIAGGVSYFKWDRMYDGECMYTFVDGDSVSSMRRNLAEHEVFIRNNRAVEIVRKVISANGFLPMESMMSALSPFGLPSSERGHSKRQKGDVVLMSSGGKAYIAGSAITTGRDRIGMWKVIIGKATSAGAATAGRDGLRKVIATLEVLEPNSACTFSYFIAGCFEDVKDAENCRKYLATKFVRFMLLQSLSSINISRDKFRFVPIQDFSKPWTDKELYEKYNLNADEIKFIESMIKPME